MPSSRGAQAPLPRPALPVGLWVVGQHQAAPPKEHPHGTTNNQATTATSNSGSRTKKEEPTPTTLAKATDDPSVSTPAVQKPVSKQRQLAALLLRDQGATLGEMVDATGWLPHTTRASLTGLKKKGYAISSDKVGAIRTYSAVAPE